MNGDGFSKWRRTKCSKHTPRDPHHDDSEISGSVNPPQWSGLERRLNKLRTPESSFLSERAAASSGNGRRRSESAPDALLDCLHCGRDVTHARTRSRKRHSRRYTYASERTRSPALRTAPAFRSPLFHTERHCRWDFARERNNSNRNQEYQCDRNRNDFLASGRRKYDNAAAGDSLTRSKARGVRSFTECPECSERQGLGDDGPPVKSHYAPCICTSKSVSTTKTSIQKDINDVLGYKRGRSFKKADRPAPTTSEDLEEETTLDDTDDEDCLDLNENRRVKSKTSFSDQYCPRTGRKGHASVAHKRRSYLERASSRHRCSANVDSLAKLLQQKAHISRASRRDRSTNAARRVSASKRRSGSRKSQQRQPLTTTDDDDDDIDDEVSEIFYPSPSSVRPQNSLLMANLSDMWRRHRLCDVTLRSNGKEVAAHKLALAAFSDTFARRYCEGSNKDVRHVIDIPGSSVGGIQEVLRFVYTGDVFVTPDNVAQVLAASAFLHIHQIVDKCKQILLKPTAETVIYYGFLVEKYHVSENLAPFFDYMCKHFQRVCRSRGWKTLTFSQVLDLLSEDNLNVERELDVFHAAVSWIDWDRTNRLTFAADLIGCVRFAYITPDEIAKHVETKDFLFQGDEGKELLLCIYRHHALQSCACQRGQRSRRLPRRRYVAQQDTTQNHTNSATRPVSASDSSTTVCGFRTGQGQTAPTPPPRGDTIVCVGGVDPFQPDAELQARLLEQFHPRQNRWTTLTHLPDGRHHHGVVCMADVIYVIGGSVLDDLNPGHLCNPTACCYRYNVSSGQWSAIAPLHTPRMYHATVVCNGTIFVIAGQTEQSKLLASMECYTPE